MEKQLVIFQVINVKFFMTKTRFASKGRIFNNFGGHSANGPGLSPSISLSVPHHPSTSVLLSTIPPGLRYFSVSIKSLPRLSERITNAPY